MTPSTVAAVVGELVAAVMIDPAPAERLMLGGAVAGHDVDTPAAIGDMVERGAIFRKMQRMPRAIQHMNRRDQDDAPGQAGQGRGGDEGVERLAGEHAAIAALRQPL